MVSLIQGGRGNLQVPEGQLVSRLNPRPIVGLVRLRDEAALRPLGPVQEIHTSTAGCDL